MPDAEWSEIIHRSNKLAAGPNAQDAAERWNSVAIWRFSSGGTLNSNHERPVRGVTAGQSDTCANKPEASV